MPVGAAADDHALTQRRDEIRQLLEHRIVQRRIDALEVELQPRRCTALQPGDDDIREQRHGMRQHPALVADPQMPCHRRCAGLDRAVAIGLGLEHVIMNKQEVVVGERRDVNLDHGGLPIEAGPDGGERVRRTGRHVERGHVVNDCGLRRGAHRSG